MKYWPGNESIHRSNTSACAFSLTIWAWQILGGVIVCAHGFHTGGSVEFSTVTWTTKVWRN